MARNLGQLTIDLLLKTSNFVTDTGRAARLAEKNAKEIARKYENAGRAIGVGLSVGFGVASAAAALYIRNSIEAEKVQAQLVARINDTTSAAGRSLAQLNAQAEKLQKLTVFDDEAIGGAQAMLLTFKQLRGINFDKAVESVLDLSTAMGMDLKAASVQLGKALNDPIKGVGALAKAGIQFSAGQKKVIKDLMETGHVAEAQQVILKELEGQMGTAAEAARDTLGGAMTALKNSFDNLLEGDTGSGGLRGARDGVESLISVLNDPEMKSGVDSTVAGLLKIAGAALQVVGWLGNAGAAIADVMSDSENQSTQLLQNRASQLDLLEIPSAKGREERGGFGNLLNSLHGGSSAQLQRELDGINAELASRKKAAQDAANAPGFRPGEGRFSDVTNASTGMEPRDPSGSDPKKNGGKSAADRAADKLAEDQKRWREELERTQAQLVGPMSTALAQHGAAMAQLSEDTKELGLTEAQVDAQRKAIDAEHAKRLAEIQKRQAAPNALLADMDAELALMKVIGPQRDRVIAQLRAEEAMRDAIAEAMANEANLSPEVIANLKAEAIARADAMHAAEQQASVLEDVYRIIEGGLLSMGDAIADFAVGGFKKWSDFMGSMKDIAKRAIADIISTFLRLKVIQPILNSISSGSSNWLSGLTSAFTGGGNSGGGMMSSIMKMFTGGGSGGGMLSGMYSAFTSGFSAAGAAGGGFWSSLMGGFQGAVSAFTGSLGAATAASTSAAGSMAAFGSEIGAFTTAGGTSAAGAGAGGLAGAAGAVSWIPIVGWIVAGMAMNDAAFQQGWRIDGQKNDMTETFAKNGSLAGVVATASIGAADTLLRKLGLSDRWASLISGSSLHTKLWGHQTPKVQATGIQGSAGFGGFSGNSYAEIKAKGGWFRSDKWSTMTGAIDPQIDRAFDAAALQISERAGDLAKQMGVDITGALGGIRIDIGKLVLDKDPEKAREQIVAKIDEVMEGLASAAVKALGFNRLLDDGFQAGEIMGALSASIALVTGGAEKLGRALSALEQENVARAVEYFEGLAIKNGGSLGDEVQRVVGMLGEYSSLITGVDTQLQTRGLNQYQSAQLQVELNYRNQVKQANALAKALGLTGARAEDLAKIEQLRAVNMADLQTQMEAQKNTFLKDLGLTDLSTLTDAEKLAESMQMLRDAVGAGDLQRAQSLSQTALGLGRNLFASGNDYGNLYGEVTGLLGGMTAGGMEGFTDAGLDNIADILTGLPDGIASAMFNLLYNPAQALAPLPAPPPPIAPPSGGGGGGGGFGGGGGGSGGGGGGGFGGRGDGDVHQMLRSMAESLDVVAANTGGSLQQSRSDSLRKQLL